MRRRGTAHFGRGSGFVLALVALGCSTTVSPAASEECEVDDDCDNGTVCDTFSTRCVAGDELAPRAHLAFDIRERGAGEILFRTEVLGCDQEVAASGSGIRELEVSRTQLSETFSLFAYATDEPGDVNAPTAEEVITARMQLRQASRFGLPPSPLQRAVEQAFTTEEVPTRTRFSWPRYSILDHNRPPPYVVWETFPTILGPVPVDGDPPTVGYAPVTRVLVPPDTYVPPGPDGVTGVPCQQDSDCGAAPNFCILATGECTLTNNPDFAAGFFYEPRCNRDVEGNVARFDLMTGEFGDPVADASVRFRYADRDPDQAPRLGVAPFGLSAPEGCDDDAACGDGRFCDVDSGRCLLALAGRTADNGATTDLDGNFATQVYNYCEADPNSPTTTRAYSVTVTPDAGMPSVTYDIELTFSPPGTVARVSPTLCVPTWGQGVDKLELPLQGKPQELVGSGETAYSCCDVGCLPAQAEDADPGAPTKPAACRGTTAAGAAPTVRFEAPLLIDAAENLRWLAQDCAPLSLPEGEGPWPVGSLRADADCPANGEACTIEGLAPGVGPDARAYAVRIQSPTGSVLSSRDLTVGIGGDTESLEAVFLPPRELVRGVVDVGQAVCELRSDPSDCASRAAIVLAERLRMPGESVDNVPGPYLHQVTTFYDPQTQRDGAFVLPLDPGGVYVMTALPAPGEDGGPAAFQIVDLRDGASAEPRRFVLEEGILVSMDLQSFDRRTFVVPLDTGSFLGQALVHPGFGRTVDLNQLGECITPALEGEQACKIRQLVPPGSNISVNQAGFARFTARRAAGASDCANAAP